MTKDLKSHTGLPLNKTANSHDGWAHIEKEPGYKDFYSVYIHHYKGDAECLATFQHHSEAVDYAMSWNEGRIGEKIQHNRFGKIIRE